MPTQGLQSLNRLGQHENPGEDTRMLILLDTAEVEKCQAFAEAVASSTRYYEDRGQNNASKRIKDTVIGKMGELASYKALRSHIPGLTEPDFEIYAGRKKSHSADLMADNGLKFSVKTQNMVSLEKYGCSWLMETKSIEKFKDDYFILCVYLGDNRVIIQSILHFDEFMTGKGAPKLAYLKTKSAFYYEDMLLSKIKLPKIEEAQ